LADGNIKQTISLPLSHSAASTPSGDCADGGAATAALWLIAASKQVHNLQLHLIIVFSTIGMAKHIGLRLP
jgi:hypothetical protein